MAQESNEPLVFDLPAGLKASYELWPTWETMDPLNLTLEVGPKGIAAEGGLLLRANYSLKPEANHVMRSSAKPDGTWGPIEFPCAPMMPDTGSSRCESRMAGSGTGQDASGPFFDLLMLSGLSLADGVIERHVHVGDEAFLARFAVKDIGNGVAEISPADNYTRSIKKPPLRYPDHFIECSIYDSTVTFDRSLGLPVQCRQQAEDEDPEGWGWRLAWTNAEQTSGSAPFRASPREVPDFDAGKSWTPVHADTNHPFPLRRALDAIRSHQETRSLWAEGPPTLTQAHFTSARCSLIITIGNICAEPGKHVWEVRIQQGDQATRAKVVLPNETLMEPSPEVTEVEDAAAMPLSIRGPPVIRNLEKTWKETAEMYGWSPIVMGLDMFLISTEDGPVWVPAIGVGFPPDDPDHEGAFSGGFVRMVSYWAQGPAFLSYAGPLPEE